jgi:hypothetical protein
MDDCKDTDKFAVSRLESCLDVCHSIPECNFWVRGIILIQFLGEVSRNTSESKSKPPFIRENFNPYYYQVFGTEEGMTKCWLRAKDEGREAGEGWSSGGKGCVAPGTKKLIMGNTDCWVEGFDYSEGEGI